MQNVSRSSGRQLTRCPWDDRFANCPLRVLHGDLRRARTHGDDHRLLRVSEVRRPGVAGSGHVSGLMGRWAFLFLDVLVTVIRLVRQRVAWVVPLLGCVAQLAVSLDAAAMA